MKYFVRFLICAGIVLTLACRSELPKITRVQVNPQNANVESPTGHVAFTAVGMFENDKSRILTASDGIDWSTSDRAIASINERTGQATCVTAGTVAVTVRVPEGVRLAIKEAPQHTSDDVTGMTNLLCLGGPQD